MTLTNVFNPMMTVSTFSVITWKRKVDRIMAGLKKKTKNFFVVIIKKMAHRINMRLWILTMTTTTLWILLLAAK